MIRGASSVSQFGKEEMILLHNRNCEDDVMGEARERTD